MKTGAELKARREELKITQQDLADKVGVSRTQLSRMESGKIKINNYIRTKIEAILTNSEEYKESELTINDIQVGDELECISCEAFVNDQVADKRVLNLKKIIVSGFFSTYVCVNDSGIANDHKLIIGNFRLKHFRKKPKLQFSDLEVGDYVYVRDDLIDGEYYDNRKFIHKKMKNGLHEITSISKSDGALCILDNVHMGYTHKMIDLSRSMKKEDYLKMNEKEIASFEELQYVANKALDESIIEKYEVCIGSYGNKNMIIHFDGKFTEYSDNSTNSGIEFIQSLYTEEFVIETMADELKIKSGAEVTLSNGMKCVYFDDGERKLRHDGDYYPCNFLVLKGAAVKQSKGAK